MDRLRSPGERASPDTREGSKSKRNTPSDESDYTEFHTADNTVNINNPNETNNNNEDNNENNDNEQADVPEDVIEISDDEVMEVLPNPDASVTIMETHGIQLPGIHELIPSEDESDDDDLMIVGSNNNPAPLRPRSESVPVPAESPQPSEIPEDEMVQIINERPIARPPSGSPFGQQRSRINSPRPQDESSRLQNPMPRLVAHSRNNPHHHHHHHNQPQLPHRHNTYSQQHLEQINRDFEAYVGRNRRHLPARRSGGRRIPFSAAGMASFGRLSPSDFEPGANHMISIVSSLLGRRNFIHFGDDFDSDYLPDSDAVETSIMNRIERENETAMDARLANENTYNKKFLEEKLSQAVNDDGKMTNNIKPDSALGCQLCGIILGEGIDKEFKPDHRYDENFEKYTLEYGVQAPWFCIPQCTDIDKELSKRVFASKCGHVFCGRCVKMIGNRPSRRTKATPSGLTINNPALASPSKCPGSDCNKKFTKTAFVEIYY